MTLANAETFDHVMSGLASMVIIIFLACCGAGIVYRIAKPRGRDDDK